jgi:hypothetical protein
MNFELITDKIKKKIDNVKQPTIANTKQAYCKNIQTARKFKSRHIAIVKECCNDIKQLCY